MSVGSEDRALIERALGPPDAEEALSEGLFTAEEVVALIRAARQEGREQATIIPRIKTAELCYGCGWTDGYTSARAGVDGLCMPTAWAQSPARALVRDDGADERAA